MLKKRLTRRWIALWMLLVLLAMLRVERGTVELEGHQYDSSRLFHFAPQQSGNGGWDLNLLGYQLHVPSRILLFGRSLETERSRR